MHFVIFPWLKTQTQIILKYLNSASGQKLFHSSYIYCIVLALNNLCILHTFTVRIYQHWNKHFRSLAMVSIECSLLKDSNSWFQQMCMLSRLKFCSANFKTVNCSGEKNMYLHHTATVRKASVFMFGNTRIVCNVHGDCKNRISILNLLHILNYQQISWLF